VIHWYQQKVNKAPERMLFFLGTPVVDDGFQANRYMVEKVSGRKLYTLTIKDVIPDDTATYYCAFWHSHAQEILLSSIRWWDADVKVFGSGTKLIVSSKSSSAPANSEILQKEHGNQITYVCLIEKFYPGVIRVMWTDGKDKEVTDNVAKGDIWKSTEKDEYSVSSWLTVPAENKDKNYYCRYEHENDEHQLLTQALFPLDATKSASQDEDCSTHPGNGTVFNRDPLIHRTAYLVYIVLLLKSFMYYLIILFFIY
ncbi:TRGC1 protein, partial [Bucco capensis]|nr:TRGC1 protein [Bucco capensis]